MAVLSESASMIAAPRVGPAKSLIPVTERRARLGWAGRRGYRCDNLEPRANLRRRCDPFFLRGWRRKARSGCRPPLHLFCALGAAHITFAKFLVSSNFRLVQPNLPQRAS